MKAYKFDGYLTQQLQNETLRAEYNTLEEEFTLISEIIQLRNDKKLTQKELARKIGTSQPAIARLESGNYKNLSLSFLRRVAEALDAVPEFHLRPKV